MGAGGGGERGGLTPPIRDKGAGRSNPYLSRLLDFCFCAGRDSSASAFCGLAANSREPIRRPRMLYGADGIAWVGSCFCGCLIIAFGHGADGIAWVGSCFCGCLIFALGRGLTARRQLFAALPLIRGSR